MEFRNDMQGSVLSYEYSIDVCWIVCSNFFFFQAEDGIRDVAVTGVQTCALPDLNDAFRRRCPTPHSKRCGNFLIVRQCGRSEERRVGKECRSRWSPYH